MYISYLLFLIQNHYIHLEVLFSSSDSERALCLLTVLLGCTHVENKLSWGGGVGNFGDRTSSPRIKLSMFTCTFPIYRLFSFIRYFNKSQQVCIHGYL